MSVHVIDEMGIEASGDFTGTIKIIRSLDPFGPPAYLSGGQLSASALGFSFAVTGQGGASTLGYYWEHTLAITGLASKTATHNSGPALPAGTPWTSPPVDKETITHDLSGTWSVSGTAQRCVEYTPGAGFPTDMPPSTDFRIFLRWKAGTTVTASATTGDLTDSATYNVVTASEIGYDVTASASTDDNYTGPGNTASTTGELLNTAASAPVSSSDTWGSASCSGGATATVTGAEKGATKGYTASVTRRPDKKFNLAGKIYRQGEAYADSVRVLIDDKASHTETVTATGGSFSLSRAQAYYDGSITFTSAGVTTFSDSASKHEHAILTGRIDPAWLAEQSKDTDDYRLQLLGWPFTAMSLVQAETFEIDDCSDLTPAGNYAGEWTAGSNTTVTLDSGKIKAVVAGGAGGITRAFSPNRAGMGGYRYLTLAGSANVDATGYGLTIGSKQWTKDYQGSDLALNSALGTAVIDLCNPSNGTATVDAFDTRWPMPTADDSIGGDGTYWGCQCPSSFQITGLPDGGTVWIDSVGMKRLGDATATWLPAYKWQAVDYDDSYRRRFLLGNTDGKSSMEETDTYISPEGVHETRNIGQLIDDINQYDDGADQSGLRNPGWTATIDTGIDKADAETPWPGCFLNKQRPANWCAAGGLGFYTFGAGLGWQSGVDVDYSGGTAVVAQAAMDRLEWYPGCGDVFGLSVSPPVTDDTIIVKARKVFRGRAWGLLISDVTGRPMSGGRVGVTEVGPGNDAGQGASDSRGVYVTTSPYGKGNHIHDIRCLESGGGVVREMLYARKAHRACFRPRPQSNEHWISYDINEAMRHGRAFLRDDTIWTGFASNRVATVWNDTDSGLSGTAPCLRYDRWHHDQPVWIAYVTVGGAVVAIASEDEGGSWTSMGTIAASGKWPALVLTRDGRHCYYWWNSAAIYGKVLDAFGGTVIPQFTAIASGVDDDAIAADEYTVGEGVWRMKLTYRSGTAIVDKSSDDGVNFS